MGEGIKVIERHHLAANEVPEGKEAANLWSRRQVPGGCTPEPPED
jgi:hypothetical protein